jgi:two-component system OmpR family sensor kinase
VSHLPVRLRLTLAFAAAMAVVLGAVGALLYVRLGNSLEEQLDESLHARAATISALVRAQGAQLDSAVLASSDDDGFSQVLTASGKLVASSPTLGDRPLIAPLDAAGAPFLRNDASAAGTPIRLFATPVVTDGGTFVAVVGASLEDKNDALAGLRAQLFVIGPLALVLASVAGYFLAAAALRPVEAMSRRATEISSEQQGQRLPLPEARDEIRRLGETLNAMLGRLEAALARERRFVADASHELRTPLALLQTELELALRRPRSSEEHERALRSAAEEVDRLALLAEDLLVLARADDGKLALRIAPVEPGALFGAMRRRFGLRAAGGSRDIEVAGALDAAVAGDRLRLEQALSNVVDNALRHGAGTVRLAAQRSDGVVELRVSDEGAGFPPDFLPHAFERFARSDEARGGGNAGLGLAIVEAITRAHGGRVAADNGDAGGAVVTLTLPAAESPERATPLS